MSILSEEPNEPHLHNNPDYLELLYDDVCNGRIIWCEGLRLIIRFFHFIVSIFSSFFQRKQIIENKQHHDIPVVPIKTPTDIYVENEKARFQIFLNKIQTKECSEETKEETRDGNENTDGLFYNRIEYREHLKNPNNELEKKWKRNILFETTPRGNIIMFYDAYKMAFSYYSNESSYPYNILNASAMKYVRSFSCIDLFMDDTVSEFKSPLIEIIENDGKPEKEKENSKKKENMKIETKNNPAFAKFKNYKNTNGKEKQNGNGKEKAETKTETNIIKNINKFVFLGKMDNFNILQKTPKNYSSVLFAEKSKFDDIFSQETELQKQVMSYSEFKRLQQKCEKQD